MMADADVKHFLDEVLQKAFDIFEKNTGTHLGWNTTAMDAPSMTEEICHYFLDEINTNAVYALSEKLATVGSFSHTLDSQQDYLADRRPDDTLECETVGETTWEGPLGANQVSFIQSGCEKAGCHEIDLDKPEPSCQEMKLSQHSTIADQMNLRENQHIVTEIKPGNAPHPSHAVPSELRLTLIDNMAQHYFSEAELQSQEPDNTSEDEKSQRSAKHLFTLAGELLRGGVQDPGIARSQPPPSEKLANIEDEGSYSCPCRFDWGLDHQGMNERLELVRDDQPDVIDMLEIDCVDGLMAEDHEVPGQLGLDALLEPEETVERSLYAYGADDMKAMLSPLKLDYAAPATEKPLAIGEPLYVPPSDEKINAGSPSRQQLFEPSPADDPSLSPTSQQNGAPAASGDVVSGHQWFQTNSDASLTVESARRVTPIPCCNRRRRVGLSRTQRVPSLHSKRLRLSQE